MSQRLSVGAFLLVMVSLIVVGVMFRSEKRPAAVEVIPLTVQHPKGYVCHRASSQPLIDGKHDDAAWQSADWTDDFVDIEGAAKPKPRYRTRVKMLWDERALYIAADLHDPEVWASATVHDSYIFHFDNDFEMFLEPDGDNHFYAELEMNALNTTWDLLLPKPYRDGGPPIDAWEIAGLRTAVHVNGTLNDARDVDRGWTIEIAWPWDGLKQLTKSPVPPRDGDQWRINFSRVQWQHEMHEGKYRKVPNTKENNWVWSPQGVIDMHRPERWGYLQFSNAAPGTVNFRPAPAVPAVELLQRIYRAQKEYQRKHGHYADSMPKLGLPRYSHPALGEPVLHGTPEWFDVEVPLLTGQRSERWHIRADSRLTREVD